MNRNWLIFWLGVYRGFVMEARRLGVVSWFTTMILVILLLWRGKCG